jgi:hypothetical protein
MSFETLVLNNIEVLGYNHQNNFFGEKSFHYSTTKTLSIRGYVLDLTNTVGVKDILTDTGQIKNIAQNFQNVIINGVNFGIGKFTSLSFDAGNWVRSTQFNADIEIYETTNLQSLVSKEFIPSNFEVTNNTSISPSPNLLGYKFYKTDLIINNRSVYYDTTNNYVLFHVNLTGWRITEISNIGNPGLIPRFFISSSSLTPPTISYNGASGWNGSITLSFDSNYVLNLTTDRFDLIKSFGETFNLDFDNNTKILGGTHSVEIEYNADNKDLSVIALAQSLATELLNKSIPINLSEYNYATREEGTYKVLLNESYDIINGKCGFTKTFSYGTNNNFRPYSLNRNLNIDLGTDGVVTVNESCGIQAENDVPSLYDNTIIGLNEQITGAYLRCSGLFSDYKNKLNISGDLNTLPLQRSVRINKLDGTIDYEINFNNDRKIFSGSVFEFTSTLDRNENYIYTISEDGSIAGIGSKNIISGMTSQYIAAQNNWNSIKNNISGRSYNLWVNQQDKVSNNFNLISENVSRSPYDGKITYGYKYSDDPSVRNDLGNIKKLEIEFSDDGASGRNLLPIYKEFIIPNQRYAIVQNRGLTRQGTFSISAKADIVLTGQYDIFNGFSYFNALTGLVKNLYSGGNQDKYLESASFTSDEIEQNVSYSEVYRYS